MSAHQVLNQTHKSIKPALNFIANFDRNTQWFIKWVGGEDQAQRES